MRWHELLWRFFFFGFSPAGSLMIWIALCMIVIGLSLDKER
jgi:hypothetical protein